MLLFKVIILIIMALSVTISAIVGIIQITLMYKRECTALLAICEISDYCVINDFEHELDNVYNIMYNHGLVIRKEKYYE